ncbi:MAG: oligosaccharide flippase family protein [Ilumatobacteraceae bacterium]
MSLRRDGIRGGLYLGSREAGGIVIRLMGVLLLTRLIGPADYGLYAGSLAVVYVLTTLAQLGTEAYLMRLPADEAVPERFHQAFSLVLVSSTVVTIASVAGIVAIGAIAGGGSYVAPFALLCVSIPVNALWAPSQALIERDLRYRSIAILEVVSDGVLYGVALPMAWAGAGVWAPICGWIASQAWLLAGSARVARFRPRWAWDRHEARKMTRFGLGYSSGSWILAHPTEIVNPLIIGPQLGAAAVGQVALALRLIDTLGFVQRATRRLSLVIFGRVQRDRTRLQRAVTDAGALQLVAVGLPLALFGLVATDAVPWLFGDEWREAAVVFPLLSLTFFVTALFNVQSYALSVLQRNAPVVVGSVLQVAVLVGAALVLVPRNGLEGIGWARLAGVAGLVVIPLALHASAAISVGPSLVWIVALGPVISLGNADWAWRGPAIAFACLVVLLPSARQQVREVVDVLRDRAPEARRSPVAPGVQP